MAVSDQTRLIIVLEAQSKKLQNSLVEVNRNIDRFAAQTERRFEQMNARNAASFEKLGRQAKASIGGIGRIVATLGLGISAREVINYADAWRQFQNKINAAQEIGKVQARTLDQLTQSAIAARAPLAEYITLYSRMIRIAPALQASEIDIAKATDIVSKAFKASGATAQEQRNGIIQLTQALGAATLQGQDLRALRNDAPYLLDIIAKHFHTTISGLKQLGKEGKLISREVFAGILEGGKEVDKAFAATSVTISDAVTNLESAFTRYVGTTGNATGATQGLIDALNALAMNLDTIAPKVIEFATILAAAFSGAKIAGGVTAATLALSRFLAIFKEGSAAAVAFEGALGPLVLIATAAAGAIAEHYAKVALAEAATKRFNDALAANKKALSLAADASTQYRDGLKSQITLQLKAAEAALTEAQAQYEAAKSRSVGVGRGGHQVTYNATSGINEAGQDAETAAKRVLALKLQIMQVDELIKTKPGTGDVPPGQPGATSTGSATKKYQSATAAVEKQTAVLLAQNVAQSQLNPLVNDYGFAMDKAKVAADLLNAAEQAGVPITDSLKASIEQLAEKHAEATVVSKKLAEAQGELKKKAEALRDSLKSVTSGFIQDLLAGKSAAEALGNALDQVANKLIGLGLDTLFGTGSGSSPFGAIGKLFGLAEGGIVANGKPQMFANGGISNSAAVFGEAGPEAAVPLPDGRRIPVDLRLPKMSPGGGGSTTITYSPQINAAGADPAVVARLERVLVKDKAEFNANVVKVLRGVNNRRYKVS